MVFPRTYSSFRYLMLLYSQLLFDFFSQKLNNKTTNQYKSSYHSLYSHLSALHLIPKCLFQMFLFLSHKTKIEIGCQTYLYFHLQLTVSLQFSRKQLISFRIQLYPFYSLLQIRICRDYILI